ncbi:mitochondrial thiamine pyrophosphate carrier-like [Nilaparvata lugens]|uniref:mitochondrial thiamine pyrophosphate carrier-like n=1 Tax=Nilaparvata lugens TaxID=108931 RepID=UPI00193CDCE2|nr:mitochondrial thiamine pyrophosphate carrier-like [Nilaparvata lugens]
MIDRRARVVRPGNARRSNIFHNVHDGCVGGATVVRWWYEGGACSVLVGSANMCTQLKCSNTSKNLSIYYMREKDSETKLIPSGELICGSLSGVMSKLVTYPWDLVRKRLQFQNFQYARVGYGKNFTCKGLINCFKGTFEGENVLGLFKGLSPSLVKAALTTALYFAFYEEILKKLNLS